MYKVVTYVPYNYVSRPNLYYLYTNVNSNLALVDSSLHTTPIDFLFDDDTYEFIMDNRKILVDQDLPVALSLIFGWVSISLVVNNDVDSYRSFQFFFSSFSSEANRTILVGQRFRKHSPELFTEYDQCNSIFRKEPAHFPSGRFPVALPFCLPGSDDISKICHIFDDTSYGNIKRKQVQVFFFFNL